MALPSRDVKAAGTAGNQASRSQSNMLKTTRNRIALYTSKDPNSFVITTMFTGRARCKTIFSGQANGLPMSTKNEYIQLTEALMQPHTRQHAIDKLHSISGSRSVQLASTDASVMDQLVEHLLSSQHITPVQAPALKQAAKDFIATLPKQADGTVKQQRLRKAGTWATMGMEDTAMGGTPMRDAAMGGAAAWGPALGDATMEDAAMEDAAMGDATMGGPNRGKDAAMGVGGAAMGPPAMGGAAMGPPAMGEAAMGGAAMGPPAIGGAAMGGAAMGQTMPPKKQYKCGRCELLGHQVKTCHKVPTLKWLAKQAQLKLNTAAATQSTQPAGRHKPSERKLASADSQKDLDRLLDGRRSDGADKKTVVKQLEMAAATALAANNVEEMKVVYETMFKRQKEGTKFKKQIYNQLQNAVATLADQPST